MKKNVSTRSFIMETDSQITNTKTYVTIKDDIHKYYLLKIERNGFDVYCFPPHLGLHYSLHASGESHFKVEEKVANIGEEPAIALVGGEAGTPKGEGIIRASLDDIGHASCICTALYPVNSPSNDFQTFQKSSGECFVIDIGSFPEGTRFVEIGVWAVPTRNQISFEFNVPNITADLLYKVVQCEPQIWIYARPC
jgi:hypothetical protein